MYPSISGSNSATISSILTMLNTRAQLGNTVATDGIVGPVAITGTVDETLPPPTTPQPPTGGSYNGYVMIGGLSGISATGDISVVGADVVIGADGDYRTPHAWLDVATTTNNTIIGFIFGIEKASTGLISFSQRVTGEQGSTQDQITNISGGGFIAGLEVGDKVSVWAAASQACSLYIHDANLGIEMACPASLKQ